MGFFDRFLPKKKPVEIKNNIPKEKKNMRKTFGVYCNANHGTSGDKLCPKCTALLATIMTKMDRCPYGITKPICDRCEIPCFGDAKTREFREIMAGSQKRMLLQHPMMTVRHKLASMGVDYAKYDQEKKQQKKAEAKAKAAKERAEKRGKGKKENTKKK